MLIVGDEIARKIPPSILRLTFSNRTGQIDNIWNNDNAAFTTNADQRLLTANGIGELIYVGESLHAIVGNENSDDADFAITVKLRGTEDLKLSLRSRHQDSNNYLGLSVDFETDIISIVKSNSGTEEILETTSHNFKYDGLFRYIFELSSQSTNIRAFVNGYNILSVSTGSFRTEPGFALYVPETNFSNPACIYEVKAFELTEQNDPALEFNPSNLLVEFRKSMKAEIENPARRNWTTFKRAKTLYDNFKDQGFSNETWEAFGYPIQEPSAEGWFGNEV